MLRAFNVTDLKQYEDYHNCPQIAGYVFDAVQPGSGKTVDWNLVTAIPRDEKMFLLAGGLNPDNVASAIAALAPDGVDCSSGVEYPDGIGKDPALVKAFVKAVREM